MNAGRTNRHQLMAEAVARRAPCSALVARGGES
jgi:hypothetical protein